jgi:hypothetical protein
MDTEVRCTKNMANNPYSPQPQPRVSGHWAAYMFGARRTPPPPHPQNYAVAVTNHNCRATLPKMGVYISKGAHRNFWILYHYAFDCKKKYHDL